MESKGTAKRNSSKTWLHLESKGTGPLSGGSECGMLGSDKRNWGRITQTVEAVTCPHCLRYLERTK